MLEASSSLEFEKALEYKNLLIDIENTCNKQSITLQDHIDRDVIGYSERENYFSLCIMTYRRGNLLGKNVFVLESFSDINEEILSSLGQYYINHNKPKELIIATESLALEIENSLEIKSFAPERGFKKDLLLIALENAKNGLDEHFLTARLEDDSLSLLEELGNKLNIPTPLRIELFDNSHLQGDYPVGAMVVFVNGVKAPSLYRKFNIQESSGKDDLKSMKEVIRRRYSRLKSENKEFPDLIIVDGGENQMHVAEEVLEDLKINIPLVGLAKNDKHHTSGLIYHDQIIPIDHKSRLFLMLVRMQDEVHRYAISFHKQKRGKGLTHNLFDDIKGIGKKRKELLMKAYPSLDSLKKASVEELEQLVPLDIAQAIYSYINEGEKNETNSNK